MGAAIAQCAETLTADPDTINPSNSCCATVKQRSGLINSEISDLLYHLDCGNTDEGKFQAISDSGVIAVFDFDCTLASRHTYFDLGGQGAQMKGTMLQNAQAQVARNPNFWYDEFGGQERILKLRWMLNSLQASGVHLYICSFNDYNVVVQALNAINCLQHFQNPEDGTARIHAGCGEKGPRVKDILEKEAVYPGNAMFIDDTKNNCDNVEAANPGINVRNCGQNGLTASEMVMIVEHFNLMVSD